MLDISKTILEKYQVRKTRNQKTEFIEFLKHNLNEKIKVEQGGIMKNRNIIIGDINKADVILTAHYDTQPVLPFPNFLTPKNLFIYFLYNIVIAVFFVFLPLIVIDIAVTVIFDNPVITIITSYVTMLIMMYCMLFGKANKHTANDNTSGVITLIEAMNDPLIKENAAFVFFDNEEIGLLGSSFFHKLHKDILKDKLVVNFDCVSDGNTIMLIYNKISKKYKNKLEQSFVSDKNKTFLITSSSSTFYPSDQMNFKNSIGVAAFHKNKILGYYIDKIHTNKDIIFDENNILKIIEGIKLFLMLKQ